LLLASLCAIAIVIAIVSRFPGRALIVAVACLAVIAWRPLVQPASEWTELHMIDVGQGDALALRTRAGHWVLFDAGRDWIGGDEGARDVVPYLRGRGGSLSAFVLSHPHADHVGGAASVLKALKPGLYFDPGYAGGTRPYETSLREARELRTTWRRVHPGDTLLVDEARLIFLAPDSAWAEAQHDPNLASAVVRIEVGDVSFLLTGDAEAPEEQWLVNHERSLLAADVLKVAHHGSRTSSTSSFLDAVTPRVALVSVGAGNMYGHPNASVLDALARRGSVVLRTDHAGSVVLRTDGHALEVESGGERWQLRPR
jgi:competence protein ComEC